jgi:hypothetical protein
MGIGVWRRGGKVWEHGPFKAAGGTDSSSGCDEVSYVECQVVDIQTTLKLDFLLLVYHIQALLYSFLHDCSSITNITTHSSL